jgi:peroxiredoxin
VPELVQFAKQAGDRVGVVGVVHEDSPASVYAFAKAYGVDYPLVRDDLGTVLRRYGPGPPITLLVRADGSVAHVQLGAFPTLTALEDAVATHLGVRV